MSSVEHLSLCSFTICISSLVVSVSFAYVLIGLFISLLLSFEGSFCILDASPLSYLQIFSPTLWLVFSLSFPLFLLQKNLSVFPFMSHVSGVKSKNSLLSPRSWRFSSVFFSKFYSFVEIHIWAPCLSFSNITWAGMLGCLVMAWWGWKSQLPTWPLLPWVGVRYGYGWTRAV